MLLFVSLFYDLFWKLWFYKRCQDQLECKKILRAIFNITIKYALFVIIISDVSVNKFVCIRLTFFFFNLTKL